MKKLLFLLLLAFMKYVPGSTHERPTFYQWDQACNLLPLYQVHTKNSHQTALTQELFKKELTRFFSTMQRDLTSRTWYGNKPSPSFYQTADDTFEPYVQKLIVPPGSRIAIHGDFHGDVHSLNRFINDCAKKGYLDAQDPFKIKDPDFYILFLGDYVDRGWYGAEVIYTILRLKNENPDQVFMVRGNHEDKSVNMRYGFARELIKKFEDPLLIDSVFRVYNFLPIALYLGVGTWQHFDVVQCCHGGIEAGFDPRPLLSDQKSSCTKIECLNRADGYQHLAECGIETCKEHFKNNITMSEMNGFMWNDFIVNPYDPLKLSARDGYKGNIFAFGKAATDALMQAWSNDCYTMRAIFRAHQHSSTLTDMMKRLFNYDLLGHPDDAGAAKLWITDDIHKATPGLLQNIAVVTFCIAPHGGYDIPYQAYGILDTAQNFSDWRLHIVRLNTGINKSNNKIKTHIPN